MRSIPLNRQRVTQEVPGDKDPSSSSDHLWVPKDRTVAWTLSKHYDTDRVQSIDQFNTTKLHTHTLSTANRIQTIVRFLVV